MSTPLPPDAARLLGPTRASAFDDGLSPLLGRAIGGPVVNVLVTDRSAAYLVLLDALVLLRRDHELEPLHDEVYRRVAPVLSRDGDAYDSETFAQDLDQLREWACVERLAEITKIRGYKDNRRERFRYRLTPDAVSLVEWLESRLAERLEGRRADGRDRLADVVSYLREAVRSLDEWRRADSPSIDVARRTVYVLGAVDDAIDEISEELLSFRAGMLAFTSRPYRIEALREILAWLASYVGRYLEKLAELRDVIDDRLRTLAQPRYRVALRTCRDALLADDARTPRSFRERRTIRDTDDQIDAQIAFFATEGRLARLCSHIETSASAVLRKIGRHLRELERRSARLGDLRAAIREVASFAATEDPRLGAFVRSLVASAHGTFLRSAPHDGERVRPPLPRAYRPPRDGRSPAPLRPKAASPEAIRALRAARDAELAAWLRDRLLQGRSEVLLSTADVSGSEAPRRWLDVARARHLGRGKALDRLGVSVDDANGTAIVGNDTIGLEAADAVVRARDARRP